MFAAPPLLPGQVHVWHAQRSALDGCLPAAQEVLYPDERARAERIPFASERQAFATARLWLRVLLSGYLGCMPAEIAFFYGAHGKPQLGAEHADTGLQFNLSHSGDWVLCAVTRAHAVGIDIEQVRPGIDCLGIAQRVLSPSELSQFAAMPEAHRSDAVFAAWTQKEAFVKATGEGFARLFARVDMGQILLHATVPKWSLLIESGTRYHCRSLNIAPGYRAALVLQQATAPELTLWDWPAPGQAVSRARSAISPVSSATV